jgi:hypothetical protein
MNDGRIDVHEEYPFYWRYEGEPTLLLGGSDEDNLYQWYGERLTDHLDLLVSVGGNYVRNVMSDRDDGDEYAFREVADGTFDLDRWNDVYWKRFETFLEETAARDIVVQLEIWDAFDWARGWHAHPWNPTNNRTYTVAESGLPREWDASPHEANHPFVETVPGRPNDDASAVLEYQERFVARVLETALPYGHVLYTVHNESAASRDWSEYWADFMHDRATDAGYPIHVADMREEDRPDRPSYQRYQIGQPERYTYLETSKNHRDAAGEDHWKAIQDVRDRLKDDTPRPMNSVKLVNRHGSLDETTDRWWRNIVGGAAGIRHHRGVVNSLGHIHGFALHEPGRRLIKGVRRVTNMVDIFACTPRNDLLEDRGVNEAYCTADPGRDYVVYFPAEGNEQSVTLDVSDADEPLLIRWYDVVGSMWDGAELIEAASVSLAPPDEGPWAVVVTADQSVANRAVTSRSR